MNRIYQRTILLQEFAIRNKLLLSLVSGILMGVGFRFPGFVVLLWLAFVPLFFALQNTKPLQSILLGLIAGIGCSLFMLTWIIPTVSSYSGQTVSVGIMAFIVIALLYAIKFMLFTLIYSFLRISEKKLSFLYILLIPAIWTGLEYLNALTTTTFPWVTFHLGYNLFVIPQFIQIAELTGIFGVSFLIISVNYLFFLALQIKKTKYFIIGLAVLMVQFLLGWFVMETISTKGRKVKLAIVQENIPADLRWNENLSDSLVETYYLSPLRKAVESKPNLVLWSETAIPWKFYQDDNLIYEVLNISWPAQAGHIIGTHSEVPNKPEKTYNSAFYIHPDGAVTGKYDKMYPLSFLETPLFKGSSWGSLMLPFFNESLQDIETGSRNNLLNSPYGKIGISICNESVLGFHSRKAVNAGANFLMVMSNDAWFSGTQFPLYHLSHSVMRAVENRCDVAVNSNGGYSAIVVASGKIIMQNQSDQPAVINGTLTKRNQKTYYTRYGDVFSVLCIAFVIIFLIHSFISKKIKGE